MTQTAKSYVCLALIFVAFGVAGEMDYRTQAAGSYANITQEATARV